MDEHFPLPLLIEPNHDGRLAILMAPFVFVDGGVEILVPAGFQTDFNSVPRGLWNFFPPWKYPRAAVVHDYLYRKPGPHSRAYADKTYRRILELSGAPGWQRWSAWTAVRLFGGRAWNRVPDDGDL